MDRADFTEILINIFSEKDIQINNNFICIAKQSAQERQEQTTNAFSDKWSQYSRCASREDFYRMQKRWYLHLYGFLKEKAFADFLKTKPIIFDAGCGLGYKSSWFAELSPESLVIGMDFSNTIEIAAKAYYNIPNLFFIQGDISSTKLMNGCIDYISCDQVIMHTQEPDKTFSELSRLISSQNGGEIACYFYAKKALPRELLDDYFRIKCTKMTSEELWEMSAQLADLGKRLSDLKVSFIAPDIPQLGIKGGVYDLQRFLYWNFIKCFWNEELGYDTSVMINFDWYSPSNARRYTEEEVINLISLNNLSIEYFHKEEACYSGRFKK